MVAFAEPPRADVWGWGRRPSPAPERMRRQTMSDTGLGDVLIRSEGGKIYLSEGGTETELGLGETPERDRLLRLLQDHGPAGVKLDRDPRLIMSSGGGSGFSWWGVRKPLPNEPAPALQNTPPLPTPPRLDPGRIRR